jgi:hypothetical protein
LLNADPGKPPRPFVQTKWEKFCTRENSERAMEDVEKILEILHGASKLEGERGPLSAGYQVSSEVLKD